MHCLSRLAELSLEEGTHSPISAPASSPVLCVLWCDSLSDGLCELHVEIETEAVGLAGHAARHIVLIHALVAGSNRHGDRASDMTAYKSLMPPALL